MTEPRQLREGALLWQPTEASRAASTMTDYMGWLERERGLRFDDYDALWRWSVDDLEAFWASVVDYYGIPLRGTWDRVLGGREMPGARWFEGAELNYAEVLLGRLEGGSPGVPVPVRATPAARGECPRVARLGRGGSRRSAPARRGPR